MSMFLCLLRSYLEGIKDDRECRGELEEGRKEKTQRKGGRRR
jgi:hypothetical protein